jgi:flagellar motility protein MotE (MotC chaperone)
LKKILLLTILTIFSFAQEDTISSLTKEKLEVMALKKELNDFYNQKEKEYEERKKELELIQSKIESEKKAIQKIHDKNLALLQDIENTVASKTAKIYNGMKPKTAASIFDEMINEGKIDDVFDIILKLKEKNVTALMKFLSVQSAMQITEKLENFNVNDVKE